MENVAYVHSQRIKFTTITRIRAEDSGFYLCLLIDWMKNMSVGAEAKITLGFSI